MRDLTIQVKLNGRRFMPHMSPTGHSGFDIYLKCPGLDREFRFLTFAFPSEDEEYSCTLLSLPEPLDCEVLLRFPPVQYLDPTAH